MKDLKKVFVLVFMMIIFWVSVGSHLCGQDNRNHIRHKPPDLGIKPT